MAIVIGGLLLGLAIAWLVMSQVGDDTQGSIQPPNTGYSGARPVPNDPGRR